MQRIDPKYTTRPNGPGAPTDAIERNLKKQAAQPVNFRRLAFHTISAGLMLASYAGLKVDMAKMPALENNYGGDLQYLTILSMIVTVLTMTLSALNDVNPGDVVFVGLKRLLAMVALPVEIVVSAVYWPLVIFAPHLMLPPKDEAIPGSELFYIPLWQDIGLHLVPAVALIIDFFYFEERYRPPASTRFAAALAMFVTAMYAFWIEWCAALNGRFPYPFLNMAEADVRIYIYFAGATFAFVMFSILNALHK